MDFILSGIFIVCRSFVRFDHFIQTVQRVGEAAEGVNKPLLNRRLAAKHGADIHYELARRKHHLTETVWGYRRILGNKADYPLLHLLKIREGLRHAEDKAVHPHGVDCHGRRRGYKRVVGGYGKGHAYRVTAAEHKRNGRGAHTCHQLSYCKPGLDIAADGVEYQYKPVHLVALLNCHELRDNVLIFGGFILR